jgi:hypothetical protein
MICASFSCESVAEKEVVEDFSQVSPYWNDIAMFLTSQMLPENHEYYSFQNSKWYKDYSTSIEKNFKKLYQNASMPIKEFCSLHCSGNGEENPVIYPLSGADLHNLLLFYPNSKYYIMIGLETPGFINNPKDLTPNEMKFGFQQIQSTIQQMAKQNYFTSILMKYKFANKAFPGVAPILLFYLSKFGYKIDDLKNVQLSDTGELVEISTTQDPMYSGLKILFHKDGDKQFRQLVFLKMYISESSHLVSTREGKFFQQFPKLNLLLKSSIYLFHMEKFESFNKYFLQKADRVVEDDSGIPIRFMPKDEWDLSVFGTYRKQLKVKYVISEANMFRSEKGNLLTEQKKFTQWDLKELFDKNAKPLTFRYGYGGYSGVSISNLIITKRKYSSK